MTATAIRGTTSQTEMVELQLVGHHPDLGVVDGWRASG